LSGGAGVGETDRHPMLVKILWWGIVAATVVAGVAILLGGI
jgi:hypothetical protein